MPITVASKADEHLAASVLASAFAADKLTSEWFGTKYAPADQALMAVHFSAIISSCRAGGTTYVYRSTESGPPKGTIVSYIESQGERPPYEDVGRVIRYFVPRFLEEFPFWTAIMMFETINSRFERWFKKGIFEAHHKIRKDYSERVVYVAAVGIHSDYQGQGIGTQLLNEFHAQVDAMPEPHAVYLEAKSEGAKRLYERHGYEVVSEVRSAQLAPTELGGTLWPMVRRPAAAKLLSDKGQAVGAHSRPRRVLQPVARTQAMVRLTALKGARGIVRRF